MVLNIFINDLLLSKTGSYTQLLFGGEYLFSVFCLGLSFLQRGSQGYFRFFSERDRMLAICLLFYVRLRSTCPKCLVLHLLLPLLLVQLHLSPISCKLYAVLLMLAYLLQR